MTAKVDKDNSLYYVTIGEDQAVFNDAFEFVMEDLFGSLQMTMIRDGQYGSYKIKEHDANTFMERIKQYEN